MTVVTAATARSFGEVVRVDDDPMGQNQSNVSLAFDARSQKIYPEVGSGGTARRPIVPR
jgi:hypothetical protein